MGITKTLAEPHHDAPFVAHLAEAPEKTAGPQREVSVARDSSPPNDAQSAIRSAEMLGNGASGTGANPRANMMMTLQRNLGNTRVSSLLSREIQTKLSLGTIADSDKNDTGNVTEKVKPGGNTTGDPAQGGPPLARLTTAPLERAPRPGPPVQQHDRPKAPGDASPAFTKSSSTGPTKAPSKPPANDAPAELTAKSTEQNNESKPHGENVSERASPAGQRPEHANSTAASNGNRASPQTAAKSQPASTAGAAHPASQQNKAASATKVGEDGQQSVDKTESGLAEEFAPETFAAPEMTLVSVMAEPKGGSGAEDSSPDSETASEGNSSEPAETASISPLVNGQIARLAAPPVIARLPDKKSTSSNTATRATRSDPNRRRGASTLGRDKVSSLVASLRSAKNASKDRIENQATLTKADLKKNADDLSQRVDAQVKTAVTSLGLVFADQRAELTASVKRARGQLDLDLFARRMEAVSYGDKAKRDVVDMFTKYRADVSAQVQTGIIDVLTMRERRKKDVADRITVQRFTARSAGDKKAASYPATERGEKQSDAALEVAQDTAEAIVDVLPDALEAVEDLCDEIPQAFRDYGETANESIDKGVLDLQGQIDKQVETVSTALSDNVSLANRRIDEMEVEILDELNGAEATAVARAKQIGAGAAIEIALGFNAGLSQLDGAVSQSGEQIQEIVDQAIHILGTTDALDPIGAPKMTGEILEFVSGATDETVSAVKEAHADMLAEFPKLEKNTFEGLTNLTRLASQQFVGFRASADSSLAIFTTEVDKSQADATSQMRTDFQVVTIQMTGELNESVVAIGADFHKTLAEVDAEIIKAIAEGLAKNDEAIVLLEPAMEQAASQAAWDHDHYVLAFLRDAGMVIGGVILGILAVIALVVIIIVAFAVAIAALVSFGVSAAIAKLLVVGGALLYLGYQIYSRYKERVKSGQGGWQAFGGTLADFTGITDIARAFTEKGLTPFERGYSFGKGIATAATFVFGRKLYNRVRSRLPKSITNPTRGAALKWMKERFGKGAPPQQTVPPAIEVASAAKLVKFRVEELRAAIPEGSRGRITMAVAVVEDAAGNRSILIGTSEPRGYLRPGVTLKPGEKMISGLLHAERDLVNYATANNLKVIDIGATRPVCSYCVEAIEPTGANISTPIKAPTKVKTGGGKKQP